MFFKNIDLFVLRVIIFLLPLISQGRKRLYLKTTAERKLIGVKPESPTASMMSQTFMVVAMWLNNYELIMNLKLNL